MKFPKSIFVTVTNEGDDEQYFTIDLSIEEIEEEHKQVAIYQLKETKMLRIKRSLE